MRAKSKGTWVETPSGGFLYDPERDRAYDPAYEYEEDRPRVYAELPLPTEPEPETDNTDPYYRPRRGVVVL